MREFPDNWRDETLEDELTVRRDRVRQLQRDADRDRDEGPRRGRGGEDRNWPASVLRQRDDERFWERMLNELDPGFDDRDPGLDAVERFDTARAASWRDGIAEAWQGRIAE